MECCGKPFKVGDSIEWYVISADRLIRHFDIDGLEYAYDAHFDEWDGIYMLKGVVKSISIYYEKYDLVPAPGHNILKPVPGTSKEIITASSEDVEKYIGELQASGYIVYLDEVTVNPAKHRW